MSIGLLPLLLRERALILYERSRLWRLSHVPIFVVHVGAQTIQTRRSALITCDHSNVSGR